MPSNEITYNGYTFPFARFSVREETVYGSDHITVEGTAFTCQVTGHVVGDSVSDMQSKLQCMRARLHVPRKPFKVNWSDEGGGGTQQFYGFEDGSNIAYGPLPGELQIDQFAGGRAAVYSWSVSVVVKDCPDGCTIGQPANAVLSISRTYHHRVDEDGFTTRTISGRLVVDSNSVRANRPADWYRFTVTPRLPTNYKRTAQEFAQSEDGRELSFSFTDVEQMWTLPQPITSGNASFSVQIEPIGKMAQYELSGKFGAPASVSKTVILQKIFDLAAAKFPINVLGFVFTDMSFTDDVYANSLQFRISAMGSASSGSSTQQAPDMIGALNALTTAPDSNGLAQQLFPYGGDGNVNSGLIAKSPALYDACTATSNGGGTESGTGIIPNGNGGTQNGKTRLATDDALFVTGGMSTEHQSYPFEYYRERFSYQVDNHLVFLPTKSPGEPPVIQQTANPTLTITQAGCFTQLAPSADKVSSIPVPYKTDSSTLFRVMDSFEDYSSPEPVGSGAWSRWKVTWRYVLCYGGTLKNADIKQEAEVRFPRDLRLMDTGSSGQLVTNPPPVAVIPSGT